MEHKLDQEKLWALQEQYIKAKLPNGKYIHDIKWNIHMGYKINVSDDNGFYYSVRCGGDINAVEENLKKLLNGEMVNVS